MATLSKTTTLEQENYELLVTKCALACARLLKRQDQSRGVYTSSRLFWQPTYKNSKRTLDCLQKSLKIADSCMDRSQAVLLFCEILQVYVELYNENMEGLGPKYINSLLEIIDTQMIIVHTSKIDVVSGPLGAPVSLIGPIKHAHVDLALQLIDWINVLKRDEVAALKNDVGISHGFADNEGSIGRWAEIIVPDISRWGI